jgi:hypothetical protein
MRSIGPEIVDDIARDFRLGVQTSQVAKEQSSGELDVRKAAKTLLDLYAQLQAAQRRDEERETRVRVRVTEQ